MGCQTEMPSNRRRRRRLPAGGEVQPGGALRKHRTCFRWPLRKAPLTKVALRKEVLPKNPPTIDRTTIARWTKATDAWRPGVLGDHRPRRTGLRGSPPALARTKRLAKVCYRRGVHQQQQRPSASTSASTPGPTLGGPLLHLQLPAQRGIPTPGRAVRLGHREQPPLGAGHGL